MNIPSVAAGARSASLYAASSGASGEAAEAAKAEETAGTVDAYAPSSDTHRLDADTVERMKAELEASKLRFIDTVQSSLTKQIRFGQGAWKDLSGEDLKQLREEARAAVSDDGYWGVEQTSQRIFAFAQALTGGDASQAETMREAFIRGYEQVEEMWGGALPEVSQKTYDAVMKLFDEWAGVTEEAEESGETGEAEETGESAGEAGEAGDGGGDAGSGGSVSFNGAKRARQLAAAATQGDVRSLLALLSTDLSDCRAGVEKGLCDESEVARVEAMIASARARMAQLPAGKERESGLSAFEISSLM